MKLIFVILSTIIIMLTSCGDKNELEVRKINPLIMATVPYKDGQVVKFKELNGSTILTTVKREISEENGVVRIDQKFEVKLNDQATGKQIFYLLNNGANDSIISTFITGPGNTNGGFTYGMNADGNLLCEKRSWVRWICHDTITLNNKLYYNVAEFNEKASSNITGRVLKSYYSKEKGLIQFRKDNGEEYTLLE